MNNRNLYDRFAKEKKIADKYNISRKEIVIKESNVLFRLLSFFIVILTKIFKVIVYLIIIGLCSVGVTYLLNHIIKIKVI